MTETIGNLGLSETSLFGVAEYREQLACSMGINPEDLTDEQLRFRVLNGNLDADVTQRSDRARIMSGLGLDGNMSFQRLD